MGYISDFSPTRNDVILSALRKLGVVRQGGQATNDQINEGQQALNLILKELSGIYKHQWLIIANNVTLTNNISVYDLSTLNLPIDRLLGGFFVNSSNKKSSLEIIDVDRFYAQSDFSATPATMLCLQNVFDLITQSWKFYLNVYPTPINITTEKIIIIYRTQLQTPTSALDKLQIPYSIYRYIVFQLAADLAHEYGININEINLLEQKALSTLQILLKDTKITSIDIKDYRFDKEVTNAKLEN